MLRKKLRELKDKLEARKRGEYRIPGPAQIGRIYAKRNGPSVVVKAEPKAYISARVKRADSDEWKDLGVIAEA